MPSKTSFFEGYGKRLMENMANYNGEPNPLCTFKPTVWKTREELLEIYPYAEGEK